MTMAREERNTFESSQSVKLKWWEHCTELQITWHCKPIV